MPKKKQSFEQALERMEEITEMIEEGNTPLEELVKLYTEGVELYALCAERLKAAEQSVTLLRQKTDGSFAEEKFGAE